MGCAPGQKSQIPLHLFIKNKKRIFDIIKCLNLGGNIIDRIMPKNYKEFLNSVNNNYDRLSSYYDTISGGVEKLITKSAINKLEISETGNLLDIGCGTGRGLIELCAKHPTAKNIVGIDISLGMCRKASVKLNQLELYPNSFACQADAIFTPFLSEIFDLILISFAFELFPDIYYESLCKEIWRLLKPGGTFLVVNIAKSRKNNLISNLYLWAHKQYPQLIDCRPINSPKILENHGFRIIETEKSSLWGIPVATVFAKKQI